MRGWAGDYRAAGAGQSRGRRGVLAAGRAAPPRAAGALLYRVLGSQADAEDLLQETLLAAWQGLPGFAERASLRSWRYRIATNRCLNWLRSASRRMSVEAASLPVEQPEPPGAARSPGSSPTLTRCWMRRAIPSPGLRSVTRGARRSHSPYL